MRYFYITRLSHLNDIGKGGVMANYLLIESRSPYESGDAGYFFSLASGLAGGGDDVTLFLVENAVLAARSAAQDAGLEGVTGAGVSVLADQFALDERGIAADGLCPGVEAASLERLVDALAGGAKAIWH